MHISIDPTTPRILGKGTQADTAKANEIGGRKVASLTWSWPLSYGVCVQLREAFGRDLDVDPGLNTWAAEARRTGRPSSSGEPPGHIVKALNSRPYQWDGAKRIAAQPNLAVLDEPGLGKTLQALAGLMLAGKWEGRHLVICPKGAVYDTWLTEITGWTDGKVYPMVGSGKLKASMAERFLHDTSGARFLITNPESLRIKVEKFCKKCDRWITAKPKIDPVEHLSGPGHKEQWAIYSQDNPALFQPHWDSIIADEADRYLLGVRAVSGKMPDWGEGLVRLTSSRRIAMTGTPFHGTEFSVFGLLHWINPKVFSSRWKFAEAYFDITLDEYGQRSIGRLTDPAGFSSLIEQWSIRRTREEVRSDLPPVTHQSHWVDMSAGQSRQYRDFVDNGWVKINRSSISSKGVLSELTKLKQLAFGEVDENMVPVSSPKLDLVIEMLKERGVFHGRGEMKYIIASQFTSVLEWVKTQLPEGQVLEITGKVSAKDKTDARESFQGAGGPRILLLNTLAGVSITLDRWCDEMFVLDDWWTEAVMEQLFGRINNRGERIAPRTFHHVRTRDTIEEKLAQNVVDQAMLQGESLDGARGIDIAARLMGRI